MILKVIFAQRVESYPGEYAPEALECADEYAYNENPSYLNGWLDVHKEEDHWESVRIVDIVFEGDLLTKMLRPKNRIAGEIVK